MAFDRTSAARGNEAAQAVEWHQSGMRQIEIAERLGRSKRVVWHILQRAGVL